MVIFKKIHDLQAYLSQQKENGANIGFIPTMGALHNGHISLVAKAKADTNIAVCSIFVNPTQFNDKSDFEKYPVSVDKDIAMLIKADCDVLFLPEVDEIYPNGMDKDNNYSFGYLETVLEGALRPGHFRGVGQVVARLLDIVQPDKLFMGQKDYQQCMVVRELLDQTGKTSSVELVICPTKREDDGLAMSSRNRRLNDPQRVLAGVIYQCLVSIQGKQESDKFSLVQKECMDLLSEKGFQPEYVSIADARNLQLLEDYQPGTPMVALVAAKLGNIRLIDNLLLN